MTRLTTWSAIAALGLLAAAAGLLTRQHVTDPPSPAPTAAARDATARLMALSLPDSAGTQQALQQWRGQVLVVNFWATWCPPCRKEMPEFATLSDKYKGRKVQFVGISIDSPKNVAEFAAKSPVPYPLLIASPDVITLTEALGNAAQGLPFTAIIDREGRVARVKLGAFPQDELDRQLAALSGS
ncbi:MAG TPA: TlpA disulfide reductase family protein [Zoogloea sp.]|uniref:TlpA family protein disulfide reductase n=1 Tax=Zoogloea sp. TaxID=49181 RepID=UPI002BFB7F3D|nr:TlpA disulfide reductase family protein [Zoogloea sp.]HMV17197.1 TlpA disulfide reductase family protein [Rhodocyclaceae bacterium]HMV64174.1 TlpA disulfide reductase family protein [Rhodocyclaceae bacterium]HMW51414.1 TlpA disulfide reductase family protein [Rhodocyclaceae bacterium]HMY48577.1 TlpA disulfide reductase family protein [Rhodocyclaceae bacterium]HMZ74888.1 TlpA disulfide reductase family protein [Rhodocyclaceae bacterium]